MKKNNKKDDESFVMSGIPKSLETSIKTFYKLDCNNFLYKLHGHQWVVVNIIDNKEAEKKLNILRNDKTVKLLDFR
jgi:hypothetical protein